jgi:aspartyl-tRNA synthetase
METLTAYKSHWCGKLQEKDIDTEIKLSGWVCAVRDLGGIIFIEIRDRSGLFQTVADPSVNPDVHKVFSKLRSEDVITIEGNVSRRPEETYNPSLPTGTIECYPTKVEVLSKAEVLPFLLEDETQVSEDLRMKYRYLDIRRTPVLNNLKLRHNICHAMRNYMNENEFMEIETPILINTTPEGARDYLVPSRVHPNKFYALPQSPQIFKQLLMVGGIERYYQIARCFRDEDLRADRQPEFTQVDIEMSFVEQNDVIKMAEGLIKAAFAQAGVDVELPLKRLTWQEAMDRFGSDKPDTRFGLELFDVSDIMEKSEFGAFADTVKSGGTVRALKIEGIADYSRKDMDDLRNLAVSYGAKGLAWITYAQDGSLKSAITKFLNEDEIAQITERAQAKPGDVVFFVADKPKTAFDVLGRLRLYFGEKLNLIDKSKHDLLWVVDFPMFEYSEEAGRYTAMHHPFTSPKPEDIEKISTDPANCKANAYDIVYNGNEIGGGSVRIHSPEVQQKVFESLGFTEEQIQEKFGFMVNAFKYGTPPHAGLAFGLDRVVALLAKCDSIREVIAFPKNSQAKCLMTDAPVHASEEQLLELKLRMIPVKK